SASMTLKERPQPLSGRPKTFPAYPSRQASKRRCETTLGLRLPWPHVSPLKDPVGGKALALYREAVIIRGLRPRSLRCRKLHELRTREKAGLQCGRARVVPLGVSRLRQRPAAPRGRGHHFGLRV